MAFQEQRGTGEEMISTKIPQSNKNKIAILLIFFLTVAFCMLTLNTGHQWGDDFAAYMADGIALDGGYYDEQIKVNGQILSQNQPFVYVWGYSLVLGLVHRLVGFDLDSFSSLVYYKVPAIVFLAVWGILLYKVFLKRFGSTTALIMSLGIACNQWLVTDTNQIQTDIQFAMLSWGCILLIEEYVLGMGSENRRKEVWLGICLGTMLYLTYITRYAGMLMIAMLMLSQVAQFAKLKRGRKTGVSRTCGWWLAADTLLPYAVFFLLYALISFMMPYAKTQASDVKRFGIPTLISNIKEYGFLNVKFIMSFVPFGMELPLRLKVLAAVPFALLTVIGAIRSYRKEYVLLIYFLATMISLLMLPYTQGLRYMFNVLPCLILFFAYGVQGLLRMVGRETRAWKRGLAGAFVGLILLGIFMNTGLESYRNLKAGRVRQFGAYTQDTIIAYKYIRTQVPSESNVFFAKGRSLSLNTGRVCHNTYSSVPIRAKQGDYILLSDDRELEYTRESDEKWLDDMGAVLESMLDLDTLHLYRVMDVRDVT